MKSYPNIESSPRVDHMGRRYYPGYSNLGVVRITGIDGDWRIAMGQSSHLKSIGLCGMVVIHGVKKLSCVSRLLENLEIRETEIGKWVCVRGGVIS